MEIRIYNQNLNFLGIIENQTSFVWNRRYNDTGDFELHAPISAQNLFLLCLGNIVAYSGSKEAGVIEYLKVIDSGTNKEISAIGRFLDSYMDRRIIKGTVNFNGKTEVAMRRLFSSASPLPNVYLGELNNFNESVEFQASYKNLLLQEQRLAKSGGFGIRFYPDFVNKRITFEVYKGVNRAKSQKDRAFVEFSDTFDNLNEAIYMENDKLLKNVAYVGGQGEGSNRIIAEIDDGSQGLSRREVFIDARDVNNDGLTESEYKQKLIQRGAQKLSEEYRMFKSFEGTTTGSKNFVYKTNYDLGDIVTINKDAWGISIETRITEISEVYENGAMHIIPTFGDVLPTSINWED